MSLDNEDIRLVNRLEKARRVVEICRSRDVIEDVADLGVDAFPAWDLLAEIDWRQQLAIGQSKAKKARPLSDSTRRAVVVLCQAEQAEVEADGTDESDPFEGLV